MTTSTPTITVPRRRHPAEIAVTADVPGVTAAVPVVKPEPPPSRRAAAGGTRRLALVASIVVSFLAASAAPTPLYQHYDAVWHGSALTTTTAFAIYAGAVLLSLLVLGDLATHLGRRPVLLAALAAQALAVVLFATAGSFAVLFAGRVIQGLAAGAALGALGATMIDLHRERGTILNAAAPGVGTGLGALVAGLFVSYLPWPTHLVYLVLLAVFAAQALGVARLPEARRRAPSGLVASLRPRIAVPGAARSAFLAVTPVLLAVWSLAGFYGSLGPALIRELAHSRSAALGGLGLFLLAGVAAVATVALRAYGAGRLMAVGIAALVGGAAGVAAAIAADSAGGFLAATALAGVGFGAGLQGAIRTVTDLAAPRERPGLLSAVFVVSYVGLGVPAVLAGLLVSQGHELRHVAIGYVLALIVFAGAAALGLARSRRRPALDQRGTWGRPLSSRTAARGQR
ncbi:Major facilitator superfamily MFS_1 [Frankia canadensis]|uniref:Major facilitator superfamily MFS_1 n=1 Tax=Frankia canadensis TaxID=1836972 RepID=A0A2I2KJG2_9ACTN|nr:MFS transporter [Frankia canadensis]SNQ45795.1 Major facilitator superfamily MFS_1 [Frankia canadensis]SOU53085.1 Major facilitator superfamily MFS_1 [Frankia canadensis]